MARIQESTQGFILFNNGNVVSHYSRRRDAVRGAARRGFVIA